MRSQQLLFRVSVGIALLLTALLIFTSCGSENSSPSEVSETLENIDASNLYAGRAANSPSWGKMAHNIPDSMRLNEHVRVLVRISPEGEVLNTESIDRQKDIETDSIKVSEVMAVRLIDSSPDSDKSFQITRLGSEYQIVDAPYTDWYFQVQALQTGSHPLHLSISIQQKTETGVYSKDIPVYDKTVHIKASLDQVGSTFFEKHSEWIITSLILPALGWILVQLFKKFKSKSS